jgi:hypothetical protein
VLPKNSLITKTMDVVVEKLDMLTTILPKTESKPGTLILIPMEALKLKELLLVNITKIKLFSTMKEKH